MPRKYNGNHNVFGVDGGGGGVSSDENYFENWIATRNLELKKRSALIIAAFF